jgi:splicing factor 4
MGWKEGEGLGGSQKGITAPIKAAAAAAPAAGEARGLGAAAHGEVSTEDDPFEAYRKRMMMGYKYRPNPLGNPRRSYY